MELRGYLTIDECGKYGGTSQAAKFFWSRQKKNKIDHGTPYLEICFDPDPEALCVIVEDGQIFGKVLEKYPDLLGKAASMFNNKLPFIIKVVSLGKNWPLEFHPSKADAEVLHEAMPHEYKDGEAKSKMIVALSLFEMFYGFRTKENIKSALMNVPELSVIIPQVKQEDFFQKLLDAPLRDIILCWLSAPPAQMKLSLDMFFARMEKQGLEAQLEHHTGLMRRLQEHCPYDPGVYAPFFLNHYTVSPGRAVHIQPGEPHAFLAGECLQVSSRTRNTVLLALTNRENLHLWRSVQQLSLVFTPSEDELFAPLIVSENIVTFRPPTREFAVDKVQVTGGETCSLPARDSGWVLLVARGEADCRIRPSKYAERRLLRGSAVYILPHQDLSLAARQDLLLFLVYPNTEYNPDLYELYRVRLELKGYLTMEEWGSPGSRSSAASLFLRHSVHPYRITENRPYSEFWLNPNPRRLLRKVRHCRHFASLAARHPRLQASIKSPLPFILKVVSVGRVNSLKIYPSKEAAEELCKQWPDRYKSGGHRPTLIIALKAFELLCGFKPIEDIKFYLLAVPELSIIVPFEIQQDFMSEPSKVRLRDLVMYWLTASDYQMHLSLEMFFERMKDEDEDIQDIDLMRRIHEAYPYNPGVFAPLFLNHIVLNRNQAVYIKPGLIHTFINGDILEITTTEGVGITLALTYKDFVHLPEGVHYMDLGTYRAEELIFQTKSFNESIVTYMPPVREFAVDRVEVQKGVIFTLPQHTTSSAFFISKGKAKCYLRPTLESKRILTAGSAIFLLPYERFSFTAKENIRLFHIYPNIECFPVTYYRIYFIIHRLVISLL